jgi:catechol 2,3-dioxygenase-like lactoylglutathione lyase family enzyme
MFLTHIINNRGDCLAAPMESKLCAYLPVSYIRVTALLGDVVRIHHIGLNVPDINAAIDQYARLGFRVVKRERPTDVDPVAIGLPGEKPRLETALLALGEPDDSAAFLEIIQWHHPTGESRRNIYDIGISHFALELDNVQNFGDMAKEAFRFNGPPSVIAQGPYANRVWSYGADAAGIPLEALYDPK